MDAETAAAEPGIRPLSPVEAWQRYDDDEQRLSAHVSERMLDLAELRPWSRVLDIATGRGEPAIRAAARVAPDGLVVGTDVSDEMLGFARARAARRAITNLTLSVTDGETLTGIQDGGFDAALCRWGFMFFGRPAVALASAHHRLRSGGLLVAALWAAPERVSWWSMPRRVLSRHMAQPPVDDTAPGPFRYAAPAAFHADLHSAGFTVEHEEEVETAVMESSTPEGLIDWALAFGLARALQDQPESIHRAWRLDMMAEAEHHRDDDGMHRLGGVTRLVVARAG